MLDPDESKIVRKYQRETNTTRKADYDQQKQKTRKTTKNKQIDKIGLHSPLHQFPTLGRQDSSKSVRYACSVSQCIKNNSTHVYVNTSGNAKNTQTEGFSTAS